MKDLFCMLILAFSCSVIRAQGNEPKSKKWSIGVQTGAGYVYINEPPPGFYPFTIDPKFSGAASLYAQYQIRKSVFFSIEPGIVLRGANYHLHFSPAMTFKSPTRLVYTQISFMTGMRNIANWSVCIGPELGYRAKVYQSLSYGYEARFDFSAALQIDYQVNQALSIGLRGSRGIFPYVLALGLPDEDRAYHQYAMVHLRFRVH